MGNDLKTALEALKEYKYYLQTFYNKEWKEVSKEEFMRAERIAGFHSKRGPGTVATGGFSGGGMRGRIEYIIEEEKI